MGQVGILNNKLLVRLIPSEGTMTPRSFSHGTYGSLIRSRAFVVDWSKADLGDDLTPQSAFCFHMVYMILTD